LTAEEHQVDKKPSCRWDSRPYCIGAPLGSSGVIGHLTIWYFICHFLLWSSGTESLSPAVFEILHSKRIGVTSLTKGHVTSSVTWPYAISYLWSFGTKPPSLYL